MDIPRIITNRRETLSDGTVCVQYRNYPRDYIYMLQRNTVRYDVRLNFVVFFGKVRYRRVPLFGDIDTKRAQCTATPNGSVRIWTNRYQYCTVP